MKPYTPLKDKDNTMGFNPQGIQEKMLALEPVGND